MSEHSVIRKKQIKLEMIQCVQYICINTKKSYNRIHRRRKKQFQRGELLNKNLEY